MLHELINIYKQCFPQKDAEAEIKALGDDFSFDILDDKCFIIFKIVSEEEAEIIDVGTIPEERQKGLATLILNETLKDLEDIGVDTIYLEVAEDNLAAINLYESCGFKQYNTRKGYYNVNGKRIDALLMKKSI